MRYSDEEKRRILEESRCLLAELDAESPYELAGADVIETTHALDYVPAPQDPLTRWREEQLELEARRKRARQMEADDTNGRRTRDWEQWADARIAKAIEREWTLRQDVLAMVVAEERRSMREHVAAELAKLEARIKALEAQQRGVSSDVVDLSSSSMVRKIKNNNAA